MNAQLHIMAYALPPTWVFIATFAILAFILITLIASLIAFLQRIGYRGGRPFAVVAVVTGISSISMLIMISGPSILIDVWAISVDGLIAGLLFVSIISSLWISFCGRTRSVECKE
jgi:hypothetical protein